MKPKVGIVIVNWNSGPQLSNVISSIINNQFDLVESIIVVDNASSDNSMELLSLLNNEVAIQLHFICNVENKGFAAACNQGAKLLKSKYLLFLNPDTLLFEKSLSVPLTFMQQPENINVGICGIQLVDEYNRVSLTCARFPSVTRFAGGSFGLSKLPWFRLLDYHMKEWKHDVTREVDHVMGAFFFVRRSLFESLNGFDERFFVYLEDLDFSFRAHQAGYYSVFLSDAQAFHAGGGTSRQIKDIRLFYSLRSRLLYGFKHFSKPSAWLLMLLTITIEPCVRLIQAIGLCSRGKANNILKAYMMLVTSLPKIIISNK